MPKVRLSFSFHSSPKLMRRELLSVGREIVQSIYGIDFNLVRSKVMDPGFDNITLSSSFLEEARFTQGYVLYRSLRNRIPREYTFFSSL